MKQVLQSYRTGELSVTEVPAPVGEPGSVVIATTASLVSVGTERMVLDLAKSSLVAKARARPDLVKKVRDKVARDGLVPTAMTVLNRLDQPIPLGYSCAGRVLAVGDGIEDISVGDRVACAGARVANHAEVNLVPRNLCARIPDGVTDEDAAFVTVGAIALHGVRSAQPTLGETFAVIGLGLVGQLAVQLLKASGCRVLGIDLDAKKVALAKELGADEAVLRGDAPESAALDLTSGRGVDGVLICAATSSNDPVSLAGDLCRDRARVVVIGAVGMDVPRRPYFDKELTFLQSRSYGPGRYDPVYEEAGVDYPIGYVRWTEQRNMQAFLQQCASRAVRPSRLVTHRFPIERAAEAYALVSGGANGSGPEPLGIVLQYAGREPVERTVDLAKPTTARDLVRIGFIGAGAFASGTLVPAIASTNGVRLVRIASARGVSARHLGDRYGFEQCTTDVRAVTTTGDIDAVFVATRHASHSDQTIAALQGGKHVFVEKPLALTREQLDEVLAARRASGAILTVGFNRRFAPLARELAAFFAGRATPLVIQYRVNAGQIPPDSWLHDPAVGGGRIIGEGCHFVDFCTFLAGAPPVSVFAQGITPRGAARADDNVTLMLKFGDGSIATIAYVATGHAGTSKERVEVLGDGAYAVLDDFRAATFRRGKRERIVRKLLQDKGHRACVRAFVQAIRSGGPPPIPLDHLAAVTAATFGAVESLATGEPVPVPAE